MGVTRSGGSLWVFYWIPKSAFYNGLTFQEARAIAKILTPVDRAQWLVWKEGWSQWKKMSAASELLVSTSAVLRVMEPPALPADLLKGEAVTTTKSKSEILVIDDLTDDEVSVVTSGPGTAVHVPNSGGASGVNLDDAPESFVVRKDQRVTAEIEVEIISQGRKFHTRTIDLSVSGVQVKEPLPPWLAGYCTLILRRSDVKMILEFVCSVVENQDPNKKKRLEIHPSKDTVHLKRWLMDFYIQQKRHQTG